MFFDKLLQLLHASNKIGFALFFAGSVTLVGQVYHLWSFALPQDQLGYVLFATLLGGGVLLGTFLGGAARFSGAVIIACFYRYGIWRKRRNIMSRLSELLPREQIALYWIANNKAANVHGSPVSPPFLGLRQKGFLIATDASLRDQTFKVNPRVYSQKELIIPFIPPPFLNVGTPGQPPPWEGGRRI